MDSLEHLTEELQNQILHEAALLAERAFRRGFEQGISYAPKIGITAEDASRFRTVLPMNKAFELPLKGSWIKDSPSVEERHLGIEANEQETPLLLSVYRRLQRQKRLPQ